MKNDLKSQIKANRFIVKVADISKELEYIDTLSKIPVLNKNFDYDIEKFKEVISNIKDKQLQSNVYTLLLINYVFVAGLGDGYQLELSKIFELNNYFDINKDLLNKLNVDFDQNVIAFLVSTNTRNYNLEQLNFLEKNYSKDELKFSNIKNLNYTFLYNINQHKEWFNKILDLELMNINNIELQNSYENETFNKSALEIIGYYRPVKDEIYNKTESFKYIYALGGDMMIDKVNKYFKDLINDIDKAHLNLKENIKNYNDLLNSIPDLLKTIIDKNEQNVLSKHSIVENKLEELNKLMSKYKEQIDLGNIGKMNLENVAKACIDNEKQLYYNDL